MKIFSLFYWIFLMRMLTIPCDIMAQDSTYVFKFEEFLNIVKSNHPVAIQATLKVAKGKAYVLKAKGGFDPKLYGNASQKYFDKKQYYSFLNGGLKIPTWFGINLEAGYQLNEGVYLNPENKVPLEGLWQAGISVPLGKGLFIDQRRAELKTATLYALSTEFQKKIIINDLLYESSKTYWDWFKAYHKLNIYQNALSNATTRFEGVKREAILGNKPYMDTLESLIIVQNRLVALQQAELEYINTKQLLEVFLWQDGIIPLEMDSSLVPYSLDTSLLVKPSSVYYSELDSLRNLHPELQTYRYKIEMEKVNLRMKKESLKPVVNLKYNALSENIGGQNPFETYNLNNYKWGAQVSFPLFIRKERGDLELTKLNIQDMEAGLANKNQFIGYKIKTALNEWNTSYNQALILRDNQSNYNTLLSAEVRLFNVGESSVFMINSREKNYIYALINFTNSLAVNQKAALQVKYSLGILAD